MFCPQCGAQLPDGSKFCFQCGADLSNVIGCTSSTTTSNETNDSQTPPTGASSSSPRPSTNNPNKVQTEEIWNKVKVWWANVYEKIRPYTDKVVIWWKEKAWPALHTVWIKSVSFWRSLSRLTQIIILCVAAVLLLSGVTFGTVKRVKQHRIETRIEKHIGALQDYINRSWKYAGPIYFNGYKLSSAEVAANLLNNMYGSVLDDKEHTPEVDAFLDMLIGSTVKLYNEPGACYVDLYFDAPNAYGGYEKKVALFILGTESGRFQLVKVE